MMKTIKYYLLFVILLSGIETQGQEFQNFKRIGSNWIIPLDFEQKFERLQQEFIEKDLDADLPCRKSTPWKCQMDSIRRENMKKAGIILKKEKQLDATDSLLLWLGKSTLDLSVKEGIDAPYPREWVEAIPSGWMERLRKRAEEKGAFEKECFTCKALVNNTGKVLSVYFRIDTIVSDLVQEKDLQAIYDAVIKKPFNPANIDFRYLDKKLMDEIRAKLGDPNVSDKERLIMLKEAFSKKKPCEYGMLEFFTMKYLGKSK